MEDVVNETVPAGKGIAPATQATVSIAAAATGHKEHQRIRVLVVPLGGQNPMEAAAGCCPVVMRPHTF